MNISHTVDFNFSLTLPKRTAIAFVQDVTTSLGQASFLTELHLTHAPKPVVTASIPVNAALFAQQTLQFASQLETTPDGARLHALPIDSDKPGWAEVSGEATVLPTPQGSSVSYHFDITIHLRLPEPEKWGGKALMKMIEFTAGRVLESITAEFPEAVQRAAQAAEEAYSAA